MSVNFPDIARQMRARVRQHLNQDVLLTCSAVAPEVTLLPLAHCFAHSEICPSIYAEATVHFRPLPLSLLS